MAIRVVRARAVRAMSPRGCPGRSRVVATRVRAVDQAKAPGAWAGTSTGMGRRPVAETGPGSSSYVQSVDRAWLVLDELVRSGRPRSVAEVARALGLNRTIVYRVLLTLKARGVVAESSRGTYTIGPFSMLMAATYRDQLPVVRQGLPLLIDLNVRVIRNRPWVAYITVPVGTDVVIVERVWGANAPLSTILEAGTRVPMVGTANGQATLAAMDDAEIERLFGASPSSSLARQLAVIRERGHIEFMDGNFRPGIASIAVAIRTYDGRPVGSISINGPELNDQLEVGSAVTRELVLSASAVARNLPSTS